MYPCGCPYGSLIESLCLEVRIHLINDRNCSEARDLFLPLIFLWPFTLKW